MMNANNGIFLVDEIENGIHYSVLPDVWRMIFHTAKRLNIQVFATTHSSDCIQAFQKAAAEDDDPNSGMLIRLERNKDGDIVPVMFDEEKLEVVARQHLEVR